ncbi:MAG: tRNA (adenosine(37)-N6)-dimethylallyltransferase MiaA [Bacteroidales bacterium]|nr:tRNA (adenosine(37)-N6)-dimethylallyltransferase MiaA [Bacteroidales bacterium]
MEYRIISIFGPTACGKTKLAANVCYHINGEIISADSRQVYKKMNLGTGKDYDDYVVNNVKVNYHLIDIIEPGEKYNLFRFKKDFYISLQKIVSENKIPVLCGGTGLYIEAILRNYPLIEVPPNYELREKLEQLSLDELTEILKSYKNLHNKTDIDTKKRAIRAIEIAEYYKANKVKCDDYPPVNSLNFCLYLESSKRREAIIKRLDERLKKGMIEEVKNLLNEGVLPDDLIYYGLEYKYITEYLLNKYTYQQFYEKLKTAICQFSKRQMTYFRGMERRGIKITWLNADDGIEYNLNKILKIYEDWIKN